MELGTFELSLKVADLDRALEFYEALGFVRSGGKPEEGWVSLTGSGLNLGLYQGHIACNLLTFFNPDVAVLGAELAARGLTPASGPEHESDGTVGMTIFDPDGNALYFN